MKNVPILGHFLVGRIPKAPQRVRAFTKSKCDSAHKVIAIVELTVDGRNVIAPIEIGSEQKVNGNIIDVNHVATYFDKTNIVDILKETVVLEM